MTEETNQPAKPKRSAELGDLAERMAIALKASRNVDDGGQNKFSKYTYVTIGQVCSVARPALAEAGVAVFMDTIGITHGTRSTKNGNMMTAQVKATFTFVAADSGQWFTVTVFGIGEDNADKAITKAYSQALKTALMKTLQISSAVDEDGDAETHPNASAEPTRTSKRKPPKKSNTKPQTKPTPQKKKEREPDFDTDNKWFHTLIDVTSDLGRSFKDAVIAAQGVESWHDVEPKTINFFCKRLAALEADAAPGELAARHDFCLAFTEAVESGEEGAAKAMLAAWGTK